MAEEKANGEDTRPNTIEVGKIYLVEKDGKLIASIAPGAVVGERAVILNEPRDATVRAAFDSTILAMSRSEFNTLLAECPSIARNILEEALTRA